jgi:hypothetical protein
MRGFGREPGGHGVVEPHAAQRVVYIPREASVAVGGTSALTSMPYALPGSKLA